MIAIVDYGVGNLFSLKCSLTAIGEEVAVTGDEEILRQAGHQFDPQITRLFDAHFDEFLKVMESYPDAP